MGSDIHWNTYYRTSPFYVYVGPNAFEILMRSSRQQASPALPHLIENPRTKKQKLFNDFVNFLAEKGLRWRGDEVQTTGTACVRAIVEALWAIDGHHSVFESRNVIIPQAFHVFSGYNLPELSKHRKRSVENLSSTQLRMCADALFGCLQAGFWEQSAWKHFKPDVEGLANGLSKYSEYLASQSQAMKRVHSSVKPVRQIGENLHISVLPRCLVVAPQLQLLQCALEEKDLYEYVVLETLCPSEPRKKYEYLQVLNSSGLTMNVTMMTYSHGNNIGNVHFLWKSVSPGFDDISNSQHVIEKAKEEIPVFHTRAMRRALFEKFGRVAPTIKPAILRALYRELTNDASAPSNLHEAEIDERVRMVIDMEDPDTIIDLRHLNSGRKGQYDVFWQECKKFLEERVGKAVDDRRHGTVTHLATAVSVRDLLEQVKCRCLEETKFPSESWLRLQFWPKTIHDRSKLHYTGKLDVKFMVQARQFRKQHKDAHYAAAIFRYQRELAITLRDYSNSFQLMTNTA